jgi:hypothetical protein
MSEKQLTDLYIQDKMKTESRHVYTRYENETYLPEDIGTLYE